VIGNPALLVFSQSLNSLLLKSISRSMKPYFQSMTDSLLWRGLMPEALPEETASIALEALHHVGTGLNDWGGIYPHEGTVMAENDLKASMVIAQRAADLLTNNSTYGHVHQTLSNSCGKHCKASSITENSDETLFQLIYPIEETDCSPLGSEKSYRDDMINEEGAYVWILWRHYQGCPNGDGHFLGEV
jgi:integrating conjugative element protein (TIGR03756 family)